MEEENRSYTLLKTFVREGIIGLGCAATIWAFAALGLLLVWRMI